MTKKKTKIEKEIVKLPDEILDSIRAAIVDPGRVKVAGLGIFETKRVKARRGRNPRTGEELTIPSYTKVRFKPTSSLKESIA